MTSNVLYSQIELYDAVEEYEEKEEAIYTNGNKSKYFHCGLQGFVKEYTL